MDAELRYLERRWKETGSAEDERGYILARVRAGIVDSERVAMASALGHEAAALATGGRTRVLEDYEDYEKRLACALVPLPLERVAQFALCCATRAIPVWQRFRTGDTSMSSVLRASEALLSGHGSTEQWNRAQAEAKASVSSVDRSAAGPDFDLGRAAASAVLSAALTVDRRPLLAETVEESVRVCAAGAADLAVKAFDGAELEAQWQEALLCRLLLGYDERGPGEG